MIQEYKYFMSECYMEVITVAAWTIWTHRNSIIFYGGTVSIPRWKAEFRSAFSLSMHRAKPTNNLGVDVAFVCMKTGHMASLLSRCRPECPVFSSTTSASVRRCLNLHIKGLIPFRLSFSDDLQAKGIIKFGNLVITLSNICCCPSRS
ncbi:hypothetical protein EJB05_15419, partial [Eragrostis curvula]